MKKFQYSLILLSGKRIYQGYYSLKDAYWSTEMSCRPNIIIFALTALACSKNMATAKLQLYTFFQFLSIIDTFLSSSSEAKL